MSPPKQARIDVEVENVEKSQYPQDNGGISADLENPSQREDTQEGSVLLIDDNTIYDSTNDVLDTVTSGSESKSELEMISHSKSQSNIKDFLATQGKNIKQNNCVQKKSDMQTEEGSNITAAESFITVPHQSNEKMTTPDLPSATAIATEVVKLMKEMKLTDECEQQPKKLLDEHQIANDLDQWRRIGNITDLVHKVPCLEFFYDEVMSESVIRCGVCFKAFLGNERRIKDLSPYEIAWNENPLGHGDPISGLWYGMEKTELYLKGGNSSWRLLKSLLRSHLLGISTSSHGRQHYLAMKKLEEETERKRKALEISKNLVKCMVTDVKLKAASTHYETLVAFLDDCGVDTGQRQHSRKQMLPLLIAAESFVDEQTSNVLKTELQCTRMYPHFFGVLDKGTVNRRTSQASYIVFMYDGKRRAYPVGAPLVYSASDEESSGSDADESLDESPADEEDQAGFPEVSGGSASDLATNLLNTIKLKLNLDQQDLTRYCGTSADGPYQAHDFSFTIREETGRLRIPEELQFCQAVIWDATHLLNLAATDIRDGKFGNSKVFFSNFIKRANEFNHMMARGKGFAQLEVSAKSSSKRASVIVPFAAQRFLSSAVGQWKSIEAAFPVLRKSFQTIHSNADDDFPLQYRMFGQDFVADLLGLLDITAPLCELMVLSQSVDFFHWKIVFWGQRMLHWMERIVDNLAGMPRYKKHLQDLNNYLFQEVELFEGWHLLSQDKVVHPDHGEEPKYTWIERPLDQSMKELQEFAIDLKNSAENRLGNGTAEVSRLLARCFDFEELLVALEGKRCSETAIGCVKDKARYLAMGRKDFEIWFKYVISLPHVQRKRAELHYLDESCADALYHCFKECLCEMFWGNLQEYGVACMQSSGKHLTQHFTSLERDSSVGIRQTFTLTLLDGKKVKAVLDEPMLIEKLYTVESIYTKLGPEFMLSLDVAIASGGSEAIAESFYAVMDTQRQRCHQSNKIMELRTKIDWLVPYIGNCTDNLIEGIAQKYLQRHSSPLLRDPRSIRNFFKRGRKSKVIHRIKNMPVKYPYLL